MKILFKIFVVLFLIASLSNLSCKKEVEISYDGIVYDSLHAKQKDPVSGITITLYTCDKTPENGLICTGAFTKIAEGTTDADGHFSIHKTAKQRAKWDVIYLSVPGSIYSTATGYYKKDLPTELYMNTN